LGEQSVSIKMNMEGKNMLVAYLLWWFLGGFGAHRFYLGRVKSGIIQLLLFVLGLATIFFFIGYALLIACLIWWGLDAYFTYKIVKEENAKLGVENSIISLSKSGDFNNELDQLEKLHNLFEKGAITKEEYESKKAALM